MKKIFTLIAVLFSITTFSFAAERPVTSKISINNSQRAFMQVKIDGRMYDLGNTFVLDNIRPGNHNITIYKTQNTGFRKRMDVVYNSTLFVGNGQQVNVNINRFGQVAMSQSPLWNGRDDHFNGNDNHFDNNHDYNDHSNHDDHYSRH